MERRMIAVIALALMAGCGGGAGDEAKATELAKVNGREITKAEFEAFLAVKRIPSEAGKQRDRAMEQYLEREALADLIAKSGALDEAAVAAEVNEFRKELLISRYFEKFLADKVTDEAVRNYYETHAAEYEDRKVHVAHILVRMNPKMSEEERKARWTAAREIHSLVTTSEDFAKVAEAKSEDRVSAKKGGDLGWLKEGSVAPAFSKKAFSMKAGEISEPFETPFGYHVIKVIDEPQTTRKPFEALAGDIRHRLRSEAKRAEIERLRGDAKIEPSGGGASLAKNAKDDDRGA